MKDGHIHSSHHDGLKKTSADFICTSSNPYESKKAPDPKKRWLTVQHEASAESGWKCKNCGWDFS